MPLDFVGLSPVRNRPHDERLLRGLQHSCLSALEKLLLSGSDALVDAFFSSWTPDLIMKIRLLSSSMFYAIEAYATRNWNITIHLRRWVYNVPEFLRKLSACDAVISGSEAMSFFHRRRFHSTDLDIYLPPHGLLPMGRYLKHYNFIYQPSSGKHPFFDAAAMMFSSLFSTSTQYGTRSMRPDWRYAQDNTKKNRKFGNGNGYRQFATFNFIRPASRALRQDARRVQLIVVRGDPIEHIVNNFHSSGVMNFLTGTHAISLFPYMTFVNEAMLVCQDLTPYPNWIAPWMDKYCDRGFEICVATSSLPVCKERYAWKRKVGDNRTWILPYKRTGMQLKKDLDPYNHYAFEVLEIRDEVASAGAALRIGPRFVYSSTAFIANTRNAKFGPEYRSAEMLAAFPGMFYLGAMDGDGSDSTGSTTDSESAWGDTDMASEGENGAGNEAEDGSGGSEGDGDGDGDGGGNGDWDEDGEGDGDWDEDGEGDGEEDDGEDDSESEEESGDAGEDDGEDDGVGDENGAGAESDDARN